MLSLLAAWTYEEGLPLETGIPGFRDSTVPVNGRIGEDIVYSSIAWYRPEESASVSGSCTGTSHYTGRPERPDYGPRQRTRPTGRDVDECLKHSSYTRVGSAFSHFFHSTSIVFMDKYLILSLVRLQV